MDQSGGEPQQMELPLDVVVQNLENLLPQKCYDGALKLVCNEIQTPEQLNDHKNDLLVFLTSLTKHLQSRESKIKELEKQLSSRPPGPVEKNYTDGGYPGGMSNSTYPTQPPSQHNYPSQPTQSPYPTQPGYSTYPTDSTGSRGAGTYSAVKIFPLVTGQTRGVHDVILQQVTSRQGLTIDIVRNPLDCDVIVIFCPIVSRVGSDVEAALKKIPESLEQKSVILVLMHHTRKENLQIEETDWSIEYPNVKTDMHFLFHDTKNGLLRCTRNEDSVVKLWGSCNRFAKIYKSPPTSSSQMKQDKSSWNPLGWGCSCL